MLRDYSFHPTLIVRTPAYAFGPGPDEHFMEACLRDARFMESLYVASPDLHEECIKWQRGPLTDPRKKEKLLLSLTKYYTRATSRCTPFGLFAGCAVARWGEQDQVRLAAGAFVRRSRLDMQYLCALVQHLAGLAFVRDELRYFPNSSLYQLHDELRYVEPAYADHRPVHQFSSTSATPYLLRAIELCRTGLRPAQLLARFTEGGDGADDAQVLAYIHQLIEARLLVSELEPAVTGAGFFNHVLNVLEGVAERQPHEALLRIIGTLKQADTHLQMLDAASLNDPAAYETITRLLAQLEVPFEKGRLFQVDLIPAVDRGQLGRRWQHDLREALDVLGRIAPGRANERLENFKKLFCERYEHREMPLLEVLDVECGICYTGHDYSTQTPLIEDLTLPASQVEEHVIRRDSAQQFLHRKLQEAEKANGYAIHLRPEELAQCPHPARLLPPSFAVMFRMTGANTVFIEGAGGSSAVNLMGRFAHADPLVREMVQQITQAEQDHNPGVLFAEIVHLPESRAGNILTRPSCRQLEVPYLAQSSLPPDQQIPLQDLWLSVRDNRLTLRSRRLNKVIVPRLGTAHNYTYQSLPVYQFLCDLQTEGMQPSLGFSWDSVAPDRRFFPRLCYRNVILHPATWRLKREDYQELLHGPAEALSGRLAAFRHKWQLPRFFTLADHDNELLVDQDAPLTVKAWLATIKNRDSIQLKEFLYDPADSLATDSEGRPYVSQFVAPLVRSTGCYTPAGISLPPSCPSVQREFTLGSEWLYYKLYCGVKSADRLLVDAIKPLTEDLLAAGLIRKWFFVRFADPDPHIRLRFQLASPARLGEVVAVSNQYLEPFTRSGYVWRLQTDTYRRELERYGTHTMHLAEALFHCDSRAVLALLQYTLDDDREYVRWLWGIWLIDDMLAAFGYGLAEKRSLLRQLKTGFAREFGMDKALKMQVDQKYRQYQRAITSVLDNPCSGEAYAEEMKRLLGTQQQSLRQVAREMQQLDQAKQLQTDWNSLLGSFMHMLLNRLLPSSHRLHEMVIYDFLFRQYQSQWALHRQPATAGP